MRVCLRAFLLSKSVQHRRDCLPVAVRGIGARAMVSVGVAVGAAVVLVETVGAGGPADLLTCRTVHGHLFIDVVVWWCDGVMVLCGV